MERKNDVKISEAVNFQLLNDKEALDLMMKLARLPEVVRKTAEENEPCTLVTYLMVHSTSHHVITNLPVVAKRVYVRHDVQDLCHSISAAHRVLWVMGREQDVAEARMLLFWAARKTLENGLKILGLAPLQRM
jgi:arginyl-tRNA synthetase